jgi:hypothetical protein
MIHKPYLRETYELVKKIRTWHALWIVDKRGRSSGVNIYVSGACEVGTTLTIGIDNYFFQKASGKSRSRTGESRYQMNLLSGT